jgi:Divergent InlB B-repeat domain
MFPNGTQVTLTASPSTGATFTGWSGGGCSGTGTCVITPTVDTTMTANFIGGQTTTNTLSVSVTGSGTVPSSPSGINCTSAGGAACSASFNTGSVVSLTQSAASGSMFNGWGGACSGVGTCVVTLSVNQSVAASFSTGTPPSSPLFAAVLPQSRSAVVNNPVTAFATILNTQAVVQQGCAISPLGDPSLNFLYQTTTICAPTPKPPTSP